MLFAGLMLLLAFEPSSAEPKVRSVLGPIVTADETAIESPDGRLTVQDLLTLTEIADRLEPESFPATDSSEEATSPATKKPTPIRDELQLLVTNFLKAQQQREIESQKVVDAQNAWLTTRYHNLKTANTNASTHVSDNQWWTEKISIGVHLSCC